MDWIGGRYALCHQFPAKQLKLCAICCGGKRCAFIDILCGWPQGEWPHGVASQIPNLKCTNGVVQVFSLNKRQTSLHYLHWCQFLCNVFTVIVGAYLLLVGVKMHKACA